MAEFSKKYLSQARERSEENFKNPLGKIKICIEEALAFRKIYTTINNLKSSERINSALPLVNKC